MKTTCWLGLQQIIIIINRLSIESLASRLTTDQISVSVCNLQLHDAYNTAQDWDKDTSENIAYTTETRHGHYCDIIYTQRHVVEIYTLCQEILYTVPGQSKACGRHVGAGVYTIVWQCSQGGLASVAQRGHVCQSTWPGYVGGT